MRFLIAAACLNIVLMCATETHAEVAGDYPIRPVPAHRVEFRDGFWWPRLEVNRTVTIPYCFSTLR